MSSRGLWIVVALLAAIVAAIGWQVTRQWAAAPPVEPHAPAPAPVPMPVPAPPAHVPTPAPAPPIIPSPRPKSVPPNPPRDLSGIPPGAVRYGPMLVDRQRTLWSDAPAPWTLAGLIEQESCVSLKSPRCWNPRAELKTYREYGFGFGQITIAYNADRSERFNEFAELRRKYASLAGWQWAQRYDPSFQLTAVVEMTHALWRQVPPAATEDDRWAFTDSSYNGGLGSLLQDRRVCASSIGCDPQRWFGNIETHSLKSRAPQRAYGGQSWFSINRGHVRQVLKQRRDKYRQFWE